MPLDFTYVDERAKNMAMWHNSTGKRLYLNKDMTRVVLEDDETASFVLVGSDGSIPMEDAIKYGLVEAPNEPKDIPLPEGVEAQTMEEATAVEEATSVEDETRDPENNPVDETLEDNSRKAQAPASDKAQTPPKVK